MCRSIKTLANFEPPATDDEIRAAAIQFVRKLSGATRPSRANEAIFDRAVDEVTVAASRLVRELTTTAPSRDRATEAQNASSYVTVLQKVLNKLPVSKSRAPAGYRERSRCPARGRLAGSGLRHRGRTTNIRFAAR